MKAKPLGTIYHPISKPMGDSAREMPFHSISKSGNIPDQNASITQVSPSRYYRLP